MEISVVLPIYNEREGLDELYTRLTQVARSMGKAYELVFVDDGSRDGSYDKLAELYQRDPEHVVLVKFSRNFGHHQAITAGMRYARGRYVVIMDSDLQDRPEEIPSFYAKIQEGYDSVYGIRVANKFGSIKKLTSAIFIWTMNRFAQLDTPISTSVFRIMNRKFVDTFNSLKEHDRFVGGLMAWVGYRQVGIPIEHSERFAGETKYTFFKMFRLALDSLTAFSYRPLQFASYIGVGASGLALLGMVVIGYRKIVLGYGILGWPSLMLTILFFSGIQLLAMGVLGEYLGRSYNEHKQRPLFVVDTELSRLKKADGVVEIKRAAGP